MLPPGHCPLDVSPLGRAELDRVCLLEFPSDQIDRYLGSLDDIVETVRRGPAHHLVGIEESGDLVGLLCRPSDRRDNSRWWLGWFGIDRWHQGGGRGRRVIEAIMTRFRQIPSCREIPPAGGARQCRRAAALSPRRFRAAWSRPRHGRTHHAPGPATRPSSGEVPARFWANAILLTVVDARSCRMGLPVAAKLHGEVAHPP